MSTLPGLNSVRKIIIYSRSFNKMVVCQKRVDSLLANIKVGRCIIDGLIGEITIKIIGQTANGTKKLCCKRALVLLSMREWILEAVVEVTGAAGLYRAACVWTAGLERS